MDVLFVSRSMNSVLLERVAGLLGTNLTGVVGASAEDYLMHILFGIKNARWLVNIDEDTFVFDVQRIYNLISFMERNSYHLAGVPDGGVDFRHHNPLVPNPFFNIIDLQFIHGISDFKPGWWTPDLISYEKDVAHLLKGNYAYDNFEPYYPIYFGLLRAGVRFLYLDATVHSDRRTTVAMDHERNPFLYHTWYSRLYNTDMEMRERIDARYAEALSLKSGAP